MNLSFVFMAPGFGKRFGANRLYAPLEGKPLYHHGLECLMEMTVGLRQKDGYQVRLMVVSQHRKILEDGKHLGLETAYNGASDEGVATSLRLGTEAGGGGGDMSLFFVADQPYTKNVALTEFVRGFMKGGFGMGCVCSMGKGGNPTAFSRLYREGLPSSRENKGGSVIMKRHPMDV